MPRAHRGSTERKSRNWGWQSGVTFETIPSGTSVVNSGVTTPVVSATNINTTKLTAETLTNSGGAGYVLPFVGATGLLMDVGAVDNPPSTGVTKIEAAYFGFTSIYFCAASVGVTNLQTGAATAQVIVTTSKPIPATGVSRVYFRAFAGNVAGSVLKRPASVQYFAIGV